MSTISFSINDESRKDSEEILVTSDFNSLDKKSNDVLGSIYSEFDKDAELVEWHDFPVEKSNILDRLIYPKFFTHMYNSDGRQYYTSRLCILPCLGLAMATLVVVTAFLYPLTVNEFTSCEFERQPLSNDIGLFDNVPEKNFWNKYILNSKIDNEPIDYPKLLGAIKVQI